MQKDLDTKGDASDYEDRASYIEEQLRLSGLTEKEVNLVMDKLVSNLSYRDIVKKYKYRNKMHASRELKTIFSKLHTNKALKHALKMSEAVRE